MKSRYAPEVYTSIREAISAGEPPVKIAERLNVKIHTVYDQRFRMRRAMRKSIRNSLGRAKPAKKTSTLTISVPKSDKYAANSSIDFVREELANVERQIDNLNAIASFLTIRLRQLEQNGE